MLFSSALIVAMWGHLLYMGANADPRIGFLALASATQAKIASGTVTAGDLARLQTVVYNNRFDAAIGLVLIAVVALIVIVRPPAPDRARVLRRAAAGPVRGGREPLLLAAPARPAALLSLSASHAR